MIDALLQEGTDRALDDQVARPRPTPPPEPRLFGLDVFAAPFQGIGGGTAKSMAFGAEVLGAFGQVAGAYDPASSGGMFSTQNERERGQAEAARQRILKGGPDYSNAVGDAFRYRAADILPDPRTASTSAQVVGGLADFATRAVGYSVTLGPLGPVAMGADTALEEADRLKQQGVDLPTRTKAGAVAGAIAGVSVAVPLAGSTRVGRAAIGVGVGEAGTVGTALAERQILRAAGYDKQADSFDPLDPVALALGIVPGVLGFAMPVRRTVKPLRTEADVKVAAQLTPAEAAREAAYERSPTNLRELERAIAAEKRPEVRAELETELRKQTAAAAGEHAVERAVRAEPDLEPAARVAQAAGALEETRLTPDADLAGRDAHLSAVEMAGDQMGRGEAVEVADRVMPHLVDAEANLRAFMDGSKVPEVVYHGTDRAFDTFSHDAIGTGIDGGKLGHGFYFSENPELASAYAKPWSKGGTGEGANVMPVRLSLRNPVQFVADTTPIWDKLRQLSKEWGISADPVRDVRNMDPNPVWAKQFTAAAKEHGHDGVILDFGNGKREVMVFDPEQIKSAIGNSGRFDPKSASLTDPIRATVAAADQLRALRPQREPAAGMPSRAELKASEAARPAPPEGAAKPQEAPKAARAAEGEGAAPSSTARAADEAAKLDPEMLVQLEGMDAPMRVGDLMAKVTEEARQDTLLGKLVEVAAACDLTA